MVENLKKETAKGVVWSGIERFASGGILFLANIFLARILSPDDFVQISQTLIDSGFSNALIQKKDRSQEDYSTVFIFNLAISIGFYLILYLCAPLVAHFFNSEKLTSLTRVIGLSLIVGALISVHKTRLTIELRFKIQSLITLMASAVSAVTAILMAYKGFGVWSLVVLSLMNISLQVILIYAFIRWRPSLMFSIRSFKKLFSYSSKLLGASLIHLLYKNIYPIVIGKRFTPLQLGYFNRADTFAMYVPSTVGQVFSRVAFPIFSRVQDNNERLRNAYSKYIFYASLIIFPIMVGMIVLAKPLTILILKDKWLPMVPMLQILCIDWMFDHLNMINLNVLYVKGRSDIAFRNEIIKKTLAFIIFFISLYWGIIGVCWGRVLYGIIAIYINSYYTKKLIGLGLYQQIKDIQKPLLYAWLMGVAVWLSNSLNCELEYSIIMSILVGIISYVGIIYMMDRKDFDEIRSIFKSKTTYN